jgi:hypothetical protein
MKMDDKFIKKLLANMKCGVCGHQYESVNVKVLGHQDDLWFVTVSCSSCNSKGIVAAVIKEDEPLEVITELTEAERNSFSAASLVDSDDVLDIHTFLKDFDGDFSSLFPIE